MTEADAFGTLSGVMAYVQRGVLNNTDSVPSYDEALVFLVQRGALVESIMAVAGIQYTPSTGTNPIPASLPALGYMTAQLNNVLTAIDVVMAYEGGEAPVSSDKVKSFLDIAQQLEIRLANYIKSYVADAVGSPAVASDISSGGVEAETFPPATSSKASNRKFTIDGESW